MQAANGGGHGGHGGPPGGDLAELEAHMDDLERRARAGADAGPADAEEELKEELETADPKELYVAIHRAEAAGVDPALVWAAKLFCKRYTYEVLLGSNRKVGNVDVAPEGLQAFIAAEDLAGLRENLRRVQNQVAESGAYGQLVQVAGGLVKVLELEDRLRALTEAVAAGVPAPGVRARIGEMEGLLGEREAALELGAPRAVKKEVWDGFRRALDALYVQLELATAVEERNGPLAVRALEWAEGKGVRVPFAHRRPADALVERWNLEAQVSGGARGATVHGRTDDEALRCRCWRPSKASSRRRCRRRWRSSRWPGRRSQGRARGRRRRRRGWRREKGRNCCRRRRSSTSRASGAGSSSRWRRPGRPPATTKVTCSARSSTACSSGWTPG